MVADVLRTAMTRGGSDDVGEVAAVVVAAAVVVVVAAVVKRVIGGETENAKLVMFSRIPT